MNIDDPHLQSVIDEKRQLDDKLARLDTYLRSGASRVLSAGQFELLRHQAFAMERYSSILHERITKWGCEDDRHT